MSSRTSTRRTAKREQIASAARRLFLSHGYAGTSMDAVTAEAGVSKQTLYSYFPTKIDLLGEVLAESLGRLELTQAHPPRLETADDLRQVLLGFGSGFTTTILRPESVALLRLILGEVFRIPELRDTFRVALPGRLLEMTTELIRAADLKGIVNAPAPEMAARMFIGPLMTFVALDGFLGNDTAARLPSARELEFIVDAFLATVEVRR